MASMALEFPSMSTILDQDKVVAECLYLLLLQTGMEWREEVKKQGWWAVWWPLDHSQLRV